MDGGGTGLALGGAAATAVDEHASDRYIAFPLSNGGSGSSLVINDGGTYGTSTQTTQLYQFGLSNVTFDVGDNQIGYTHGGSALFSTAESGNDDAAVLRSQVNDSNLRFSGSSSFVVMCDMKVNDANEVKIHFGGNNGWTDSDGWWVRFVGTNNNNRMGLAYANHTGNPTYANVDMGSNDGLGGWHQFAWAYSGGTFSAYIDGVRKGQVTGISNGTWASYNHSNVDGGDGDTMLALNGSPYPLSFGNSDIIYYANGNWNANDFRIYTTNFTGHAASIDVKPSLLATG